MNKENLEEKWKRIDYQISKLLGERDKVFVRLDEIWKKELEIKRSWAMPNKKTFEIKPIKKLLKEEIPKGKEILDPFPFKYKKDATEFLNEIEDESYEYAVFDPPYSPRQLKECYKGKGEYDTKNSTWSNWKDLLARKIKIGGKVISFGWNSGGLGINRGFKIKKILLVAHGGNHNDTIIVVEEKVQLQLNSQNTK